MSDYCYTAGESPFCTDMSDVSICKDTNRSTYSSITVAAAASARDASASMVSARSRSTTAVLLRIDLFRVRPLSFSSPSSAAASASASEASRTTKPGRARAARPTQPIASAFRPPSIATAARGTLRALGFPGTPVAFPGPPGTFSWSRRRNPTGTKCGARSASSRWIARCRRLSKRTRFVTAPSSTRSTRSSRSFDASSLRVSTT